MPATAKHLLYRLLYDALVEIRFEGSQLKSDRVFLLADLFHNIPLQLEQMDDGLASAEDILQWLKVRANTTSVSRWLEQRSEEIANADLRAQSRSADDK